MQCCRDQAGSRLMRDDGRRVEDVSGLLAGRNLRALAAGEDSLWAITAAKGSGRLWRSDDGRDWENRPGLPGQRARGPGPSMNGISIWTPRIRRGGAPYGVQHRRRPRGLNC